MYAAEGTAGVNMVTVLQNFWVDANTNINMRDSDGKTALMYAVSGKTASLSNRICCWRAMPMPTRRTIPAKRY